MYEVVYLFGKESDPLVLACLEDLEVGSFENEITTHQIRISEALHQQQLVLDADCALIDINSTAEEIEHLLQTTTRSTPCIILTDAQDYASIKHLFVLGAYTNVEKNSLRPTTLYHQIEQGVLQQNVINKSFERQALALLANEIKSIFLQVVSHNLRTPLNGILLSSEMLSETPLDNEQCELVEIVKSSGERLKREVENIFNFTELESDRVRLKEDTFLIEELIENIVEYAKTYSLSKGLDFQCSIDSALPKSAYGDSNKIRQVLQNLIENACQASNAGSTILLKLQLVYQDQEQLQIQFSVIDRGCGMDDMLKTTVQETLAGAKVANHFKNADSLGLGLQIVHHLIEILNGSISFDSTLAQGTSFHFTIPVIQAPPKQCRVA